MTEISRRNFLQSVAPAGLALAAASTGLSAIAGAADQASPSGPHGGPKFRLGIVTYNIAAQWDLQTILKVLKSVGIGPVEFRTGHKHGVEPSLSKDQRKTVRKQCEDAGVEVWGCGTTCEFQSPDQAVVQKNIEECKRFIELSADLGGKGVKVRPNGLPKGVPTEKTLEQIGKSLVPCGQAAADAGLEIFVEVHGPGTSDPPNARRIMEQCNHPKVGLCWNSNPGDVIKGSVAESFKLLQPWLRSCHINELWKDQTGAYPYRELFRLMRESGYDRVTLCEVGKTPPDAGTGEEILRYYKALWTELSR